MAHIEGMGLSGSAICVTGANASVSTSYEDLYALSQAIDQETLFATPAAVDVASSSANDDAAGTGALTIKVVGLDANKALVEETLTLDGQTKVVGTQTFSRVIGAYVATAGSGLVNAGDIYIVKTTTGGVFTAGVPATLTSGVGKILAGEGRTRNGWFSAPRGVTYRVAQLFMSAQTQAATFAVYTRSVNHIWELIATFVVAAGSTDSWMPMTAVGLQGEGDIIVRAKSATGTADCSCVLELVRV